MHSDQFPGHPDGINSMISITDNVVMTGCEDGNIRAVHLYPHRFLGVVGQHEQELPIERMDVSSSGEFIASISHDNRYERNMKFRMIIAWYLAKQDQMSNRCDNILQWLWTKND